MSIIHDGTGSGGFGAKVTSENRLYTDGISTDTQQAASLKGDLYRISTDIVTLTSDSESCVFYVQNNNTENNLIVPQLVVNMGKSTGATNGENDLVKGVGRANISTGTIISNAVGASLIPLRLDVAVLPAITTYQGVEGDTAGPITIDSFDGIPQGTTQFIPFFITLPPNASFAICYTPPAGNTNLTIQTSVRAYFDPIDK